ncbi:MAG: NifU family protein [Pseudomonadota bacterium]
MFIQTESTPNPATLKFLPGKPVSDRGIVDFASPEAAGGSLLAERLFAVDGVVGVMFGEDFISVTKGGGEWQHLKPSLLGAIMDFYLSGAPVFRGDVGVSEDGEATEDDEVIQQIRELIDTRVRPAVAQDGGDIIFDRFDAGSGTVFLQMRGACSGCPSSTLTLKSGIENLLRHYVPEVNGVEQVL